MHGNVSYKFTESNRERLKNWRSLTVFRHFNQRRFFQAPLGVICLNAFPVKNISSVRLKIAVGSTPSSLYISKPSTPLRHSGVLQILSFHLRISPASPHSASTPLGTGSRCFSSPLPRSPGKAIYGSVAVFKNFSGILATGQAPSPKGRNRVGDARQPEIDRLHSDAKLPPMPQR